LRSSALSLYGSGKIEARVLEPDKQDKHHGSHDFEVDLRLLREQLTAMSLRCRNQLHAGLDAFWSGSKDRAADVEAADRAIDRDEKDIDALVLRILALRQPVASDLRMLTASFRLVTDLERIGDEAVNIAETTASGPSDGEPLRQRIQQMADSAENMLAAAVASLFGGDAKLAEQVRRMARTIDAVYDEVFRDAVAFISKHPTEIASALSCITVAKCLDKVASHAANIAKGTLFVAGEAADLPR
jgi:phosphate transport system protein